MCPSYCFDYKCILVAEFKNALYIQLEFSPACTPGQVVDDQKVTRRVWQLLDQSKLIFYDARENVVLKYTRGEMYENSSRLLEEDKKFQKCPMYWHFSHEGPLSYSMSLGSKSYTVVNMSSESFDRVHQVLAENWIVICYSKLVAPKRETWWWDRSPLNADVSRLPNEAASSSRLGSLAATFS